jgi:hypothetical protein
MRSRKSSRQLTASADQSVNFPPTGVVREINRLLNARLAHGRAQRKVIQHNLEAGQIAENVFRDVLRQTLPFRFGVAKGKLVSAEGVMSRHLDVIVYDALNCPALFIDENDNQILPVEGVYAVIEVKSATSKSVLEEAFEELASVEIIHPGVVCSTNELVDYVPPILKIFSFEDSRSLETIHENFVELNQRYPRKVSASSYSKKSPGSKDMTGEHYMINSITIAEKGTVYHMLDGSTAIGRWGDATAGLMFSSLLSQLFQIELQPHNPLAYLSWLHAGPREIYRAKTNAVPKKRKV